MYNVYTPTQNEKRKTMTTNPNPNIDNATYEELKTFYDTVLNADKSTYTSSNDEPTPIACIEEMIAKIPAELWHRTDLKILDPCCGNGNFALPVFFQLWTSGNREKKDILEQVLVFNDINEARLTNMHKVFQGDTYALHIYNQDFLQKTFRPEDKQYDLIMANPPYAKLLENGKRASKNHNLIQAFIERSLALLKPDGYLLFLVPDNWMSYADRNTLIEQLTLLQIVHLDIHSAKRHFKKIGSSFTWFVIQNRPFDQPFTVSGLWKKTAYESRVASMPRKYIPLLYNATVQGILAKTLELQVSRQRFHVETSSDLHRYTKAALISNTETEEHRYRLIHTPKQTVYASRPHKWQEGYKVFISTTDKYQVFVDGCGMTQSIVFIRCASREEAETYAAILRHPLYVFLNNIAAGGISTTSGFCNSCPCPCLSPPIRKIYTNRLA